MKRIFIAVCYFLPMLCSGQIVVTIMNGNTSVTTPNGSGQIELCAGQCVTLIANVTSGTQPYTYMWYDGTNNTTVSLTSQYVHCVSNAQTINLYLSVSGSAPADTGMYAWLSIMPNNNNTIQPICIVTIDTSVNKNLIVWEQTNDSAIVSYNLYKETTTTGIYNLLANIPSNSFSTYLDTSSHPDVKSAKYYLTTVDTACGTESYPSISHKTMHLVLSPGVPPAWNLIWDNYTGISFLKNRIWRGSALTNLQLIDSVSTSSITYTDLTPPAGIQYYLMEIVSPNVCNPSLKIQNTFSTYSSSLSNVVDNTAYMGIDENNSSSAVWIYPNPSFGQFTIQSGKTILNATISVANILGEKIFTSTINPVGSISNGVNHQTSTIDLSSQPNGMYYVHLQSDTKSIVKKLIIQK